MDNKNLKIKDETNRKGVFYRNISTLDIEEFKTQAKSIEKPKVQLRLGPSDASTAYNQTQSKESLKNFCMDTKAVVSQLTPRSFYTFSEELAGLKEKILVLQTHFESKSTENAFKVEKLNYLQKVSLKNKQKISNLEYSLKLHEEMISQISNNLSSVEEGENTFCSPKISKAHALTERKYNNKIETSVRSIVSSNPSSPRVKKSVISRKMRSPKSKK